MKKTCPKKIKTSLSKASFLFLLILPIMLNAQNNFLKDGWIDHNKNGIKDIYEDTRFSTKERVNDLLNRMTLDEKIAETRSGINRSGRFFDPTKDPIGQVHISLSALGPAEGAERVNEIQKAQLENSRLGIPLMFVEEALHGLCAEKATSFPQAIMLASTWNTELMEQVSTAIAIESGSRGVNQVLSPVVDIGRDPRWGRTQETYGEDTYLVSRMAIAFCKSFESRGIVTTPKHFVANSGDGGRDSWAQFTNERHLREVYFPPYKAAIQEAGSRSLMPSYGSLNGLPTVADPWLLSEIARKEWGFTGYFGSDYGAVEKVKERHAITDKDEEVPALCFNAGMDVEWPSANYYDKPFDEAVKKGLIDEKTINETVKRLLTIKFDIGLFEDPFTKPAEAAKVNDSKEHRALALEAARQGIVLLKNENDLLPFEADKIKKILILGERGKEQHLGGYSGTGMKKVPIIEGMKNHLPDAEVIYHHGVQSSATPFIALPGNQVNDGKGFKTEIFSEAGFEGEPLLVRKDNAVFWRWWPNRDIGLERNSSYSVRWTGEVEFNENIESNLLLNASGEVHVYVNDEEILNNLGTAGTPESFSKSRTAEIGYSPDMGRIKYTAKYIFKKGETYNIEVTYQNEPGFEEVDLMWDKRINLERNIREATELAKNADAVLIVPGGLHEGEFRDRPDLDFPPEEEKLINSIAGINPNTVVLLVNGAAVTMLDWERNVPAIVETWYSGEEGGNAIAEVLLGKYNPAGRLPVTFPKITGQAPLYYNYHPIGRERGFQGPLKGRPMFPFGHGISYTEFEYSNLKLSTKKIQPGENITISFMVKNKGDMAGDEVTQCYIHDTYASVVRPVKELKGFQRIHLEPGESKMVEITLTPEELSMWNRDMDFVMEPGEIEVYIGASSEDIRLTDSFLIIQK